MRSIGQASSSLLLLFGSLVVMIRTASAVRDYSFQIVIVNQNAPKSVCTDAEYDDLYERYIPTVIAVLADPKYDLKATSASEWRNSHSVVDVAAADAGNDSGNSDGSNRKERELQSQSCADYCRQYPYHCSSGYYNCIKRRQQRMLRSSSSERELTEADVIEIKTVTEGAMRGLLKKFANTSPYSTDCTKALLGATVSASVTLLS